MERELRSIVIGARLPQMLGAALLELRSANLIHCFRRPIIHLPGDEKAGFALSESRNRLAPTLAHDGVAFPMSEFLPRIDALRPGIDHAFVRNDDLRVFLMLSALLAKQKVLPECSVIADPIVDDLRADMRLLIL